MGLCPIRIVWDVLALTGSYHVSCELNEKARTTQLNCIHFTDLFPGVALIFLPVLQVLQFVGLVNSDIIITANMDCGPDKLFQT